MVGLSTTLLPAKDAHDAIQQLWRLVSTLSTRVATSSRVSRVATILELSRPLSSNTKTVTTLARTCTTTTLLLAS